jgi:hypothetical protein
VGRKRKSRADVQELHRRRCRAGEWAKLRKALVIKAKRRRCSGCAMKECDPYLGRSCLVAERPRRLRSEKSAEAGRTLDEWMRHRLRAIQFKHWRRGTTMYRELKAFGASGTVARQVAGGASSWWRTAWCGPACWGVWEGGGQTWQPLI